MKPNALHTRILQRIAIEGPLPLSEYMRECLWHPTEGYYAAGKPIGAGGDFVTAPEISQMFGELIGLWALDWWRRAGAPTPVQVVELGPGRGTLMADLLRAACTDTAFRSAVSVQLIEAGKALRAVQEQTLEPIFPDIRFEWSDSLTATPGCATILIANEFFDALPVRQFRRTPAGWREVCVGARDERFILTQAARPTEYAALLDKRFPDSGEGEVAELTPSAAPLVDAIADRIANGGGIALIVDYGYESGARATVQAVKDHEHADFLEAPGEADLSAHVDFAVLRDTARERGVVASKLIDQGDLLRLLGIEARAAALSQARPDKADGIEEAVERLTAPARMGTLFKALALWHKNATSPFGFDAFEDP